MLPTVIWTAEITDIHKFGKLRAFQKGELRQHQNTSDTSKPPTCPASRLMRRLLLLFWIDPGRILS